MSFNGWTERQFEFYDELTVPDELWYDDIFQNAFHDILFNRDLSDYERGAYERGIDYYLNDHYDGMTWLEALEDMDWDSYREYYSEI